jgi:ABC-type Zn2+ transport system substrate-binding protein/surface adhesin
LVSISLHGFPERDRDRDPGRDHDPDHDHDPDRDPDHDHDPDHDPDRDRRFSNASKVAAVEYERSQLAVMHWPFSSYQSAEIMRPR